MSKHPLAETLKRLGAIFAPESADGLPPVALHFGDELSEYQEATSSVGLADLSARARLELTGDDRCKFLNNLCTNDIVILAPGASCEAFFLDARGRILDFVTVFQLPESIWIDAEPGRGAFLLRHLDKYRIREKVEFHDRTQSHAQLHLTGPAAEEVVAKALAAPVELARYGHRLGKIGHHECQIRQHERSVHAGFDIVTEADHAEAVWKALLHAGREDDILPIGQAVLEVLRIEAGLPIYGKDFSDNLAQEIGRDARAISFNKGCYLGQETVARLDAMGHVNKLLRGLSFEHDGTVAIGAKVRRENADLGVVSSTTFSPALGRRIALGVLRVVAEPGSIVAVEAPAGPLNATVTNLPIPIV